MRKVVTEEEMQHNIEVGKRIRDRRLELGLSQTQLMIKTGLSNRSTIACIETGKRTLTQRFVPQFAKALKCSESYIMGWQKDVDLDIFYEYKHKLNDKGIEKLHEYYLDLLGNPLYKR